MTSPKKRAKSRATAKVARNFLPELRQQLNRPQRQPKTLDETMPRQAKGGDQAQTERGIRRTAPRGQPPRTVPPQLSYLDAGFKPRGPSRQATASPTNRKHGSAQGQAGGRRQQRYAPYSRPPSANSSVPDRDAGLRQTSRSRNSQRTASPRAQMGVNNTHSESQPNPAGASAVGAAATEHLLTLAAAASRRIQQEGFHLQNTSRPSSRHSSNPPRLEPIEYIRDPRGDEYRGLAGGFNQHALTHEPSFYPNPHHEPEAHRRDRMRAEALNVSRAMEYLNNIADYNARVLAHYDGTNEVTFTHWTQMLWVLTEQFRRERYAPVPRTPPQFTGEEHIRRLEQPYLHPMAPPPPPPPHLRYDAPRDSFGCYWGPGTAEEEEASRRTIPEIFPLGIALIHMRGETAKAVLTVTTCSTIMVSLLRETMDTTRKATGESPSITATTPMVLMGRIGTSTPLPATTRVTPTSALSMALMRMTWRESSNWLMNSLKLSPVRIPRKRILGVRLFDFDSL